MKNCVFTICAKNYIGLAQILGSSLKKANPDLDYYIFVADELPRDGSIDIAENIIECKGALENFLDKDKWDEMAFKYNLTEFCTSIKSYCFEYLFRNRGYEKVIFLDPDIYIFSSFDDIFSDLDEVKIILTPHITTFDVDYKGERSEQGLLSTGLFNLGFLALRKSEEVYKMLAWWAERLKTKCYIDVLESSFTDQKWMDFIPCFFDSKTVSISRHLGLNVAPWNFFEREIYQENDKWFVKNRIEEVDLENESKKVESYPLVFVHYSGYDYKSLLLGNIVQNNIQNLGAYKDVELICALYSAFLKQEEKTFNLFIKFPYSYSIFTDGLQITHFHRRIFRSLIEENEIIRDPFSTGGSLYSKLLDKKILIRSNNENVDKLNKLNMPDSAGKLMKINALMRFVFKLIGIKNYTLILRLMRPYSKIENQIHLLDSRYGNKLK